MHSSLSRKRQLPGASKQGFAGWLNPLLGFILGLGEVRRVWREGALALFLSTKKDSTPNSYPKPSYDRER